jgi:hypothetical protein
LKKIALSAVKLAFTLPSPRYSTVTRRLSGNLTGSSGALSEQEKAKNKKKTGKRTLAIDFMGSG